MHVLKSLLKIENRFVLPMNRQILSVILFSFLLSSGLQAQTFELIYEDTILNSSQLNSNPPPSVHVKVKNISGSLKQVRVQKQVISKPASHQAYFCWGINCYSPAVMVSPDILPLDDTEIDTSFVAYVNPGGTAGTARIRYCFQDADNPTNQTCIVINTNYSTTSVTPDGPSERLSSVQANYDPFSQTIHVDVSGGKIDVMNMLGQAVPLSFRYDGSGMSADASNLKTGYYFLFGKNENGPWSARVIVTKQ